MTTLEFHKRIRAAIADETLQGALDANTERRTKGRAIAFASLPDWRERRQRAHAVRAEVIAHLNDYVAALSDKATQNGIHVHRALNGVQASRLVIDIAESSIKKARAKDIQTAISSQTISDKLLFAKSKSMVSEEIELNRALESRGHRAVETDLGEYIVQLRGEKPAHIITPAVHLQRHQVGELFQKHLGLPYTDDIPTLTAAARKVLREVFLTADIGISGVNFGVAETGTLCIVTNEGNGRMVTSLPSTHISLMGMERILPTLDDLALMLSLLPRSATGQKLSVYTQLLHSPRREGEIDGPAERHLIIIDNGRSRLHDSTLREALYCIRCGACLNACPVFREIGGHAYVGSEGEAAPYPGPIGSVISPGLFGIEHFGQLAQASSLCEACKEVCPVNIDLPAMLKRVRAGNLTDNKANGGIGLSSTSKLGLKTYGVIAASPYLFHLTQRIAALGSHLLSPFSTWLRLPAFTGWGSSRDLPRPAWKPFHARWHDEEIPVFQPTKGNQPPLEHQLPDAPQEPEASSNPNETDLTHAELVERLVMEAESVGAKAHRTTTTELTGTLIEFLRSRSTEAILSWDSIDGVDLAQLEQSGVRLIRGKDPTIKAGLTGCVCAIAETGTVILATGAGQPLSTSLLPEVHICIVHSMQIVFSLQEALRKRELRDAAATILVTGPSRTADIEMTLTIGVHGPRELHLFIVNEDK